VQTWGHLSLAAVVAMVSLSGELPMTSRKDFFLRIARSMSEGDIDHVAEWFTEDFKLHDPSIGGFRSGHEGARDMLRALAEHVPCARIDILDMVEEGNKVAVRWLFSGKKDGSPVYLSVVAIYRFVGDRIAEDWGIAAKAEWPVTGTDN
jgi:predicted ester cyclase